MPPSSVAPPQPLVSHESSSKSEIDALDTALHDMTAAFSRDFAGARVGQHHNTFAHRTRVLRQMNAQLARMRAQDVSSINEANRG